METLIKAPQLELKGIKTFIGREGYGLNATLYVDGIKTAFVRDDASGGEINYDVFNKPKWAELDAYIKTLPKVNCGTMGDGGEEMFLDPCIDFLIDELVNAKELEKAQKKIEKKMDICIMWGVPKSDRYREAKFKKPFSQWPKEMLPKLQEYVNGYKAKLKEGEQILNTNLQKLGIVI